MNEKDSLELHDAKCKFCQAWKAIIKAEKQAGEKK